MQASCTTSGAIVEGESRGTTRQQRGGLLLVGIVLMLMLTGTGCSSGSADNDQPQEVAAESESEAELSASEQNYAEYLETLSPKQIELRESLNPDALAAMSESEMTAAFTIMADEVIVDGKIDAGLYAEAFAARMQAMGNSGLSDIEYAKWGGLDNFGTDTKEAVVSYYNDIQTKALFGYEGTDDITRLTLSRGTSVDMTINSGGSPQPERYHMRMMVTPPLADITEMEYDQYDIRFSAHISDNWERETMDKRVGLLIYATDANLSWDIKGLYVTDEGSVLPTKITSVSSANNQ